MPIKHAISIRDDNAVVVTSLSETEGSANTIEIFDNSYLCVNFKSAMIVGKSFQETLKSYPSNEIIITVEN